MKLTSQVAVLLATAMLSLHASGSEGRKLNAAELEALVNSDYLSAGVTNQGWAFASVNRAGGEREVYVNNFAPFVEGRTRKDTATVKGEKLCVFRHDQQAERCFDVFHLKGDVYESRQDGLPSITWTMFKHAN